jgi:hypothetical protein
MGKVLVVLLVLTALLATVDPEVVMAHLMEVLMVVEEQVVLETKVVEVLVRMVLSVFFGVLADPSLLLTSAVRPTNT